MIFIADLIACSICFGHHYAHHQELEILYKWLLPVVFGASVFKLSVCCGAEGYVSGLNCVYCIVLCVLCAVHGTQYTPQPETLFTTTLLNI